jgi:tetratricopeptide (TPR) repeat protein
LILGKPQEFIELKKSIYYNLALVYRENNEVKNALYFYFNFYKLNPENVSIIVEIAILFRKELLLEQSCYFFEQALGKETSAAMKLIYSEQVAILSFVTGNHALALKTVDTLLDTEFKRHEMEELRLLVLSEMKPSSRERFDFFSPNFEYLPSTSSGFDFTYCRGPYSARILELRSEFSSKKVANMKENNRLENPADSSAETFQITIPKLKWQEIVQALQTALRIQKHRSEGRTLSEIRSKIEKTGSHGYLSNIDFDYLHSQFEVKVVGTSSRIVEESVELSHNNITSEAKEVPREERYGGGQMALREKKSSGKADTGNPEADFTKRLENCLHDVLKVSVDSFEFNFLQSELAEIFIGKTYGLAGDSLEVRWVHQNVIENTVRDWSRVYVEEPISSDSKDEKTRFSHLNSDDIEAAEEREFHRFFQEELQGGKFTILEIVKKVMSHLLAVKRRTINHTGLTFNAIHLEGPSPILYLGE